MENHTRNNPALTSPGPWETDGAEIYGPSREWIGEACNPDLPDNGAANARLMALGPELLGFIAKVVTILDRADYVAEAREGLRLLARGGA